MPTQSTSRRSGLALLALLFVCLAPTASSQERVAFRAKKLVPGVGPAVADALMLVVDGKIESIRSGGEAPKGYRLVDLGEVVVAAGMIDLVSKATAPGDLAEGGEAIDLASRAADVIVPEHRDLGLLRAAGVTSVLVLPDDKAVVSGHGAVMKCLDRPVFVAEDGPIATSLTNAVVSDRRYPTSFMGALDMLGKAISAGSEPALVAVREGRRPAFCLADDELRLRGAVKVMKALACRLVLVTDGSLRRVLPAAKGESLDVVLPAPNFETAKRDLLLPAAAVAAGHRIAFRAETPRRSPEALRLGAALAVRNGLDADLAWAALTAEPARMAGVGDRIGTLAVGRDADFIVLTGHPIDLASELRATYIAGKPVHERPARQEKADS